MPFDPILEWREVTGLPLWSMAAALLLLLVLLSWFAGWLRKRRRGQAILTALRAVSRGQVEFRRGPGAWGFVAAVTPPDPFQKFSVSFRAMSILDPIDCLRRLGGAPSSRLHIWAILHSPPEAELVWARGQVPARALGRGPGRALWEIHRLDVGRTEYATRGLNTAALRHTFLDLYARFSPALQRIVIQREGAPQFEVVVAGNALDVREVSALLTTLCAAGRAAQIG